MSFAVVREQQVADVAARIEARFPGELVELRQLLLRHQLLEQRRGLQLLHAHPDQRDRIVGHHLGENIVDALGAQQPEVRAR